MWDYLGFASGLQLVFVVAEAFVIEPYVFCQGADLLEPHFLCKRALDAVTLVHNLSLQTHRDTNHAVKLPADVIHRYKILVVLTGNEGGKMMCLGALLNVPTAMTALTGMVNI